MKKTAYRIVIACGAALFVQSTVVAQTLFTPGGTIAASGNSGVGIGTSAPTEKLEVAGGSIKTSGASVGMSRVVLQSTAPGGQQYEWYNDFNGAGGGVLALYNRTAGNFSLAVTAQGSVGIGTMSPMGKFNVAGDGYFGGRVGSIMTSPEGGNLLLENDSKTGATTYAWVLWNMTGAYGNGLSFWRYFANGTNAGPSVWFGDNGNVGIGTTIPAERLEVAGNVRSTGVVYSSGDGVPWWIKGTGNGPAILLQKHVYTGGSSARRGSLGWMDNTGVTSELLTWSDSGNVGIGTTNPTQKLSVNGAIQAKEVIVQTGWSDYVFDTDYHLAPLSEVEQRIKAEKHLPGIPSAKQVAKEGISLGDMQAKLLAKIEELTLHVIAQEKRIEALEAENRDLKHPTK